MDKELESIFNLSPDMIGLGNLDGYFTRINHSFEQILGYSDAEFMSKPFIAFIHDDDIEVTKNALQDAVNGKSNIHVKNRYRCIDGTYKWIEWRVLALAEEDKFYAVGRDVDDQVEIELALKESQQRLISAGKVSYDLIYEWDVESDRLVWFGDVDKLLGFEQGGISHDISAWVSLIHPDDRDKMKFAVEQHRTEIKPIKYQYRIQHKDGSYRYWMDNGLPLLDSNNHPYKWVGVCTDVTEQKKSERALRLARDQAERANQTKNIFLANMSHELRTPMSAILLSSEILSDTPLSGQQRSHVDAIRHSGNFLLTILNDILDFSKIEAGHIDLVSESFDLHQLMEDVHDLMSHAAHEKGLDFSIKVDDKLSSTMIGDLSRIRQVINNLVDNAIKFTSHGDVSVSVDLLNKTEDTSQLVFSVMDSGIGIEEKDREQIFEHFYQINRSSESALKGTGLGLAICKRFVEAMGGTIDVESSLNQGSKFWFQLDLQDGKEGVVTSEDTDTAPSPRRVLLVEDEPVNRFAATLLLEKYGHSVTTAENGQEALDKLSGQAVDLILMDIHMPIMNGLETTQAIRTSQDGHLASIPIIGLSASVMTDERRKYIESGMNDVMAKPMNIHKLNSIMVKIFDSDD